MLKIFCLFISIFVFDLPGFCNDTPHDTIPMLVGLYNSPTQSDKFTIREQIKEILWTRMSETAYIERLKLDDYAVVKNAIYMLGELKSKRAVPLLIDLLNREKSNLAYTVVSTLEYMADPDALEPLLHYANVNYPSQPRILFDKGGFWNGIERAIVRCTTKEKLPIVQKYAKIKKLHRFTSKALSYISNDTSNHGDSKQKFGQNMSKGEDVNKLLQQLNSDSKDTYWPAFVSLERLADTKTFGEIYRFIIRIKDQQSVERGMLLFYEYRSDGGMIYIDKLLKNRNTLDWYGQKVIRRVEYCIKYNVEYSFRYFSEPEE